MYDAVCFLSLCVETSPYSTSNSSELDAASKNVLIWLPRPTKVELGRRRTLVEPKGWRTTVKSRDWKAKVEHEDWKTLAEATRKAETKESISEGGSARVLGGMKESIKLDRTGGWDVVRPFSLGHKPWSSPVKYYWKILICKWNIYRPENNFLW